MQAILDHLSSVLVGATVLLMVATLTRTSLDAAIGGGEHHATRAQELALAAVMTQDLRNVGAAGADDPIVSGTDSTLVLEGPVVRGDTARTIEYRQVRDTVLAGEPIYRVERYVQDTLSMEVRNVASWQVHCLDENGDTLSYGGATYKQQTRSFGVEFALAPGAGASTLGSGRAVPRRWTRTVHPYHLRN